MAWSSRREALATLDKLAPNFKFLGASFWMAWQLVLFGCEVEFMGFTLDPARVAVVYVAVSLSFALALVLVGVFHKRVFAVLRSTSFTVSMGALAALGTALMFALQVFGGAWFAVGAVMAGVGTAFIACRSIMQFAELGPREVIFMAALVQVAAFTLDYTVLCVATVVQPWLFFALPIMAGILLCLETEENRVQVPEGGWKMPRWFWRFAVGILFFAVPLSICRACFPLYSDESAILLDYRRITGIMIMAIMVLIAVVALFLRKDVRYGLLAYRLILLVSVIYVVLAALGPQNGMVMSLSGTVNAVLNLCVWVLLARIAFKSGASTLRVFGFGYSAFTVGSVVGWGVGLLASATSMSLDSVVTVLVVTTILVLFVALFLFRQSDLEAMMQPIHATDVDEAADYRDDLTTYAQMEANESADEDAKNFTAWRKSCLLVTENANLSSRESEVFDLLVRGLSARAVSEELCISYNTARNHIQRIYAKLGVHSRDELHTYLRDFTDINIS